MKKPILVLVALLCLNLYSIAQTSNDTLYFKHTFWRGNALWKNGHFIKIKKLQSDYNSNEMLASHIKNIRRTRMAYTLSTFGGTWLTAGGVLGFLINPGAYIPNSINLLSGIGVNIGNYALQDIEADEMKYIASEINKIERK